MRSLALAIAALAAACSHPAPKPVQPSGDSMGAVLFGMTVRGREFPAVVPHRIEQAYFAQVGYDGELDMDSPILSNARAGDYVMLLNVPPGRYAPVAGAWFHKNVRYLVKIDPALSNSWITEVRPGSIAFVGDALLRTDWEGPLLYVLGALKNVGAFLDPLWHPTIAVLGVSPRLDVAVEDEAAALYAARRALGATMWTAAIDKRMHELGDPPEPIRKGVIFRSTVQPTPAGRFAYIDTLGWGAPVKVPGGLEWRQAKGRARVLARFLKPGDPGYKPLEEYLREMREAGSPDDAHTLFQVALASRTAQGARYTTYQYPEASLTGSEVRVLVTETLLVPDADGFYLLRLRAVRSDFKRLLPAFRKFAGYVVFLPPEKPT